MKALIKIRLMKIRRNPCKNVFQYIFTPFLLFIPAIFIIYFKIIIELISHYDKRTYDSKSYSVITNETLFLYQNTIGIICEDDTIFEGFKTFVRNRSTSESMIIFNRFKNYQEFITCINNKIEKKCERYNNNLMFMINGTDITNLSFTLFDYSYYNNPYEYITNDLNINYRNRYYGEFEYVLYHKLFSNFVLSLNQKEPINNSTLVHYKQISRPPIRNIFSVDDISSYFPLVISLTHVSVLFNILFWMISEKQERLVEFLNRQGITQYQYILSWFITFISLTIVPSLLLVFVYKFNHFFYVLFFLILFNISIFASAFFYHSLIDKIQTGSTIMKILYIGVCIFSIVIVQKKVPLYVKILFSIFPQILNVMTFEIVEKLDNFESIDWTLWNTPNFSLSLLGCLILYIVNIALYFLLGLFITFYRRSGVDFITFVMAPFKGKKREIEEVDTNNTFEKFTFNHQEISPINQEKKNANDYLSIRGVSRFYGQLAAVNNFSGEIYGGEIFCLLGHNGAGKTTLIKMISGIEDPDKGDIFLGNTSLVTNKDYLFKNIGLCAQDDIYFDYLTVKEHLALMSELKGSEANINEINELIQRIELFDKADALCSTLSGGQKRKLCIALALIGNSKLILLDEPTSGMDVIAKRALWRFLKGYKGNKIIILTTHSLDEAEYLGDRIGIMSEGVYLCSGSSSYLKSKYPCGYNVNCIINSSVCTPQKKAMLINELKAIDQSAEIKLASKSIVSINFTGVGETISNVFTYIDRIQNDYGIENYTVSTTTLEDVFLKLNHTDTSFDKPQQVITNQINDNSNFAINNSEPRESIPVQQVQTVNAPVPSINLNMRPDGFSQFKSHLNRYFVTLWRTKSNFILELFAAGFLIIFFVFGFGNLVQLYNSYSMDFIKLLKSKPIYYIMDKETEQMIKSSTFVSDIGLSKIDLRPYPYSVSYENIDIDDLDDNYYDNNKYKFDKDIFLIRKHSKYDYEIINLVNQNSVEYFHATMNMIISSIFEKQYGIKFSLNTINDYPRAQGYIDSDKKDLNFTIGIASVFLLWYSFLSFGGYIMLQPLKERIYNVKHMLYLSGANMFSYWSAMGIVDFLKFMIFIILILPLFLYLDVKYGYLFILFIPFSIAMIIVSYIFSFLISKEENGQKNFILGTLAITFALPVILFFRIFSFKIDRDYEKIFYTGFFISECDLFPTSSLIVTLIRGLIYVFYESRQEDADIISFKFLAFNHSVIFLSQAILYGLLLLLFEKRIIGKLWNFILIKVCFNNSSNNQIHLSPVNEPLVTGSTNNQINYVQQQIDKINSQTTRLTTIIQNLKKTYYVCCGKNVKAINRLYLGLEANEKFGLLGFNGSGKTTTFKAITNEIFVDDGTINLHGFDTNTNFDQIRQFIGYCPQENALFNHLNVYDTLSFYKSLKGVYEPVEEIANRFGLGKYLQTITTKLSGGNKRKLIFAIALMNNPKMLLLDEPSTGVDPESRRIMWKNINHLESTNPEYNMILTTHSMEEAEILCDTVSWLKQGNFVCVGNPEKLKLQFSAGYKLHIKFNAIEGNVVTEGDNIGDLGMLVNNLQLVNYALTQVPASQGYFALLYKALSFIRDKCSQIVLNEIGDDFSFELTVKISKENQGEVFYKVLNMKNVNDTISEISINMQSLENILTSCENASNILGV